MVCCRYLLPPLLSLPEICVCVYLRHTVSFMKEGNTSETLMSTASTDSGSFAEIPAQ